MKRKRKPAGIYEKFNINMCEMKRKRKPAGIYEKFNINMCPSPNGMAIDF